MNKIKMKMSKKTLVLSLTATLLAANAMPAMAGPTLYDSFTDSTIDIKRWRSGYTNEGAVELITQPRKGDLFMRIRGIADATVTTGNRETMANRLFMNNDAAAPVRMFQLYGRVNLASVRDCSDAGAPNTQAQFLHVAQWFNTGTSTGSEDYTGNVYSIIGFRKSAETNEFGNRVDILANVAICSDSDCTNSQNLWFERLGSVAVKENVLLRTAWDKDAKQFRFSMKPQGEPLVTQSFSYTGVANDDLDPVTSPSLFPRHQLRAQSRVAQCDITKSGNRRPFATIDTKLYNVRIDTTAQGY